MKQATYEDVLNAPDHKVAEILDGELFLSPLLAPRSSLARSRLVARLVERFDLGQRGPYGWWILGGPELHLGADVVVPDLAGWRRERMPEFPDVPFFTQAADWVCEILSPSTERLDRGRKLRVYAGEGVGCVWLLNVEAHTLEVFRLQGGQWLLDAVHEGPTRVRAQPFEAVELSLARLWDEPG